MMSLEEIIERFDKNKDGMLSLDEFSDAVLYYFPGFAQEIIERGFKEIDVNRNGEIDNNEFVSWFESILKKSFDRCDVDNNERITVKEWHSMMTNIGKTCTEESCAEEIRAADKDNDGCLNYEEFKAMFFRKSSENNDN